MIRVLGIIDTETSGLTPETGELLEVGCVAWSIPHRAMISAHTWLLKATANEAVAINKLEPALLTTHGQEREIVLRQVKVWLEANVDVLCAYNAEFDRMWLPHVERPWFDAQDLQWPGKSSSGSLVAMALANRVGVVDAHRALADCLTLARMLERVAELMDLTEVELERDKPLMAFNRWLERGMLPRRVYEVADKTFDAIRNELAKQHGFRWEAQTKAWRRRALPDEVSGLPFRVVEVQP